MFKFSEKKIIITFLFLVSALSTILIYLMLWKDINTKRIINNSLPENLNREQITNLPKVEIETSK